MTSNKPLLGFFFGFIGVVIFGITLPMIRVAVTQIDPFAITAGRAMVAGLAALATVTVLRRPIPLPHAGTLFLIGLCAVAGFPGFSAIAMQTVPAAHGGVVLALLPLATAMAAVILGGEIPSLRFWVFAAAGAAMVLAFAMRGIDGSFATGDLWLLASIVCAALGYTLSGRLSRVMPGWEVISWVLVLWLPLSALAFFLSDFPAVNALSPDVLFAFVYLAIGSQFLGFFAWNAGLALGGVARIGQVQLLQPFITLFAAALLLGETVDWITIGFAIAVAVVVALGRNAPVAHRALRRPAGEPD